MIISHNLSTMSLNGWRMQASHGYSSSRDGHGKKQ